MPPFSGELSRLGHHYPLAGLHSPQNVLAEEQKEVADRGQHKQPRRPGAEQDLIGIADPRKQRQPLDLYREDKKDIKLKIRKQEGESQEYGTADKDVRRRKWGMRNETATVTA